MTTKTLIVAFAALGGALGIGFLGGIILAALIEGIFILSAFAVSV